MDRAQPGATGSLVHSIEAGESWGQATDGWVVPSTQPTRSSQAADSGIDETALNAFDETHSTTSLTVTIDPGEGFVDGWLARDVATDVELAASTAEQTVFVGWDVSAVYSSADDADRDAADTVIVGLASAFGDLDPTIPLWTFNTDGSGVTSVVDERLLKRHADRPAAHHTRYSNEEARDAAGGMASDGLSFDDASETVAVVTGNGLIINANGKVSVPTTSSLAHGTEVDAPASAHHTRYSDSEARSAVDGSSVSLNHDNLTGVSSADHHSRYTDGEARSALSDGTQSIRFSNIEFGNIANSEARLAWDNSEGLRFYWDGAWRQIYSRGPTDDSPRHSDLEGVSASQHHTRYSDSEARSAVDGSGVSLDHDNLTGVSSGDHHARYSDEEAQDAVGTNVGDGVSYDDAAGSVSVKYAQQSAAMSEGDNQFFDFSVSVADVLHASVVAEGDGASYQQRAQPAAGFKWDIREYNGSARIYVQSQEYGTNTVYATITHK